MDRARAWDLLNEMTHGDSLLKHARAVELSMRAYAAKLGEDPELFGNAGLLHDADYEAWPEEHPRRIVARLRELGEEALAHAISAHYTKWNVAYESTLDKVLVACDELTGFVTACAKVRPDGITTLEARSVMKKLKDKAFAAKVERDEIQRAVAVLGVDLAEHLTLIIAALAPHAAELGLEGRAPSS
jgi:predicted hydrolase (HD superfamily)